MCARHPCTDANLLCVSALHLRFSASDHAHGRGARPGRESHIFSCCNHSVRLVRPPLPSALTELSATTAAAFSCLYRQNRLPVRLACMESCLYNFLRHHLPVRPESRCFDFHGITHYIYMYIYIYLHVYIYIHIVFVATMNRRWKLSFQTYIYICTGIQSKHPCL